MGKVALYTQAYNSEKYIQKCIESVLNQTYRDFNYYLIDNGSTDNTWRIIREYAQKDNRIILVRIEENTRFLLERYIFLAYKNKHDYFAILDSDDWYEPTFVEKIVKTMLETNSDLVSCASTFVFQDSQQPKIKRPSDKTIIVEQRDFSSTFPYLYTYYGALWGRIYKTSIFVENNILGNRNIKYGADTEYVMSYQKHCKRVSFYPEPLHNYHIRKSSVSHKFDERALISNENFYKSIYIYLEKINGLNTINLTFCAMIYLSLITNIQVNTLIADECTYEQKFHILFNVFNSQVTIECWNRVNNADDNLKNMLDIDNNLIKYRHVLFNYICKSYNKKYNDQFYEMICFLVPLFREMCDTNDVKFWIENISFLNSLANLERNEVVIKLFSKLNSSSCFSNVWKALKKLINDNILLKWIENKCFVVQYSDIIKYIYLNKFSEAMEKIIKVLTNGDEIPFEEELLFMCLNVSAILEDGRVFVYAKKLQTQLFIMNKRFKDAEVALDDLFDMCPEDNDVQKLKKWLEEENV